MEIFKYCLQRICDSPFDKRKHIVPAVIGAAATIGSALLANASNRNLADKAYRQQQEYNNWLLRNQTQESVRDLRSAGLNPAFMNGAQLGDTPAPPSYDTPEMKSPIDLSSAMMFSNLIAQTRKTNAEAENLEMLNEDKKRKNEVIAHEYDDSVWMLDGKPISDEEANRLLMSSGSEKNLPNFVIRPYPSKGAEGRLQGEQMLKRWDKEISDINVSMLQNELQDMVTKGQISNPNVLSALEEMPYRLYNELISRTDNIIKDTLKKQSETSNLGKQGLILDIQELLPKMVCRSDSLHDCCVGVDCRCGTHSQGTHG